MFSLNHDKNFLSNYNKKRFPCGMGASDEIKKQLEVLSIQFKINDCYK